MKFRQAVTAGTFFLSIALAGAEGSSYVQAAFRFVAWADTKNGTANLTRLSNQAKALSPVLTIYPGDAIASGNLLSDFEKFGAAVNGGANNGMLDKTFAVRGNHDSASMPTWEQYFQFGPLTDPNSAAAKVGVTNYEALTTDLTYSFDYQNAHFVGIDVPGNAVKITAAQLAWLDQDLARAAAAPRSKKHAFIFFHGPIYTVNGHMASVPTSLVTLLKNHPIVSATFHGHEHVEAHTTLDKNRIPELANLVFEQFVTGTAGAGAYSCTAGRSDYCDTYQGFMLVDVVSDTQFKVGIYKDGVTSPQWERTFTKGVTATPPPTTPTRTPTPSRTSTPGPTLPPGSLLGDANGDCKVDGIDYVIWLNNFVAGTGGGNPSGGDFNRDGRVDGVDYVTWLNQFVAGAKC